MNASLAKNLLVFFSTLICAWQWQAGTEKQAAFQKYNFSPRTYYLSGYLPAVLFIIF
jgi:hypothetical protein